MIFFFPSAVFAFWVLGHLTQGHKDVHLYDVWLPLCALSFLSVAFIHAVTATTSGGVSLMEACARFLNESWAGPSLTILSMWPPVGSHTDQQTHAQCFLGCCPPIPCGGCQLVPRSKAATMTACVTLRKDSCTCEAPMSGPIPNATCVHPLNPEVPEKEDRGSEASGPIAPRWLEAVAQTPEA